MNSCDPPQVLVAGAWRHWMGMRNTGNGKETPEFIDIQLMLIYT